MSLAPLRSSMALLNPARSMSGMQLAYIGPSGTGPPISRMVSAKAWSTRSPAFISAAVGVFTAGLLRNPRNRTGQLTCLEAYGAALGLAFQVVDDILDVTADSATLGKTAGKDAAADKPTFVSLLGLARSHEFAQELLQRALGALDQASLGQPAALKALAHMVVNRSA